MHGIRDTIGRAFYGYPVIVRKHRAEYVLALSTTLAGRCERQTTGVRCTARACREKKLVTSFATFATLHVYIYIYNTLSRELRRTANCHDTSPIKRKKKFFGKRGSVYDKIS